MSSSSSSLSVCPHCCQLLPSGTAFISHVREHSEAGQEAAARVYTCDKCHFETGVKSCLKMHMLTHTVACPFCPFESVRSEAVRLHILSSHNSVIEEGASRPTAPKGGGRAGRRGDKTGREGGRQHFSFVLGQSRAGSEGLARAGAREVGFGYLKVGAKCMRKDQELVAAAGRWLEGLQRKSGEENIHW